MFPSQRKDGGRCYLVNGGRGNGFPNQRKDGRRGFQIRGRMGEGVFNQRLDKGGCVYAV